MSGETAFELARAEKKELWDREGPRIVAAINASSAFALLAVRSSLILNGGALFAFPAFVSAYNEANLLSGPILLYVSAFFIGGVFFGALCAFLAYWNFQFNHDLAQYSIMKESIEIDEGYDVMYKHRLQQYRKKSKIDIEKKIDLLYKRITYTLFSGNVSGIASYVCFFVGCYQVGRAFA